MHNLRSKILAGVLAFVTAASPAASELSVYAAAPVYNDGDIEIDTESMQPSSSTSIETAQTEEKDNLIVFNIDIADENGAVVLNEGKDDEQTIRTHYNEKEKKTYVSVSDKDGKTASQEAAEQHTLTLVEEKGTILDVKAVADAGYDVATYTVTSDAGGEDELVEDTGFELAEDKSEFSYKTALLNNENISVSFVKKSEDKTSTPDIDIEKSGSANTNTAADKSDDTPDIEIETSAQTEAVKESETEAKESETTAETTAETERVTENSPAETEKASESESAAETEGSSEAETEAPKHFMEKEKGAEKLNSEDFASMRLVVLCDKDDLIIDKEDVIGKYDNLFLLQYSSVEQAMNAYVYYTKLGLTAEPDTVIATASEETEASIVADKNVSEDVMLEAENPVEMSNDQNPVEALNTIEDSKEAQKADRVIALIDTGASEGEHIVGRVSVIDDVLSGNGHADQMVNNIVSQNPDAKILSIRAMNDDGRGTASALISAMEYAISQNVSIINLSLYAKKTLTNSIIEQEINKAMDAGIAVVGAAGNSGDDASNYVPGAFDRPYVIGAADSTGTRLALSNYGETVDYYVMADSTSDATSLFSGYISANGADNLDGFSLLVKEAKAPEDNTGDIEAPVVDKDDAETSYSPVIENYVKDNADPSYTKVDKLEFSGALMVQQLFADAAALRPSSNLQTIVGGEDIAAYVGDSIGITAIYNLSDDSDYYVSYANTMQQDSSSTVIDVHMAMNNSLGLAFDDYHYDAKTGLVYIPKKYFFDKTNNTKVFNPVQIEFVQKCYFDDGFSISSNVSAFINDNNKLSSSVSKSDIMSLETSVKTKRDLDTSKAIVCVNGIPYPSSLYFYNSDTGKITIGTSPAMIQNISVYTDGEEYNKEVNGIIKAAVAYKTYDEMDAVNTNNGRVWGDYSALTDAVINHTLYKATGSQAGTRQFTPELFGKKSNKFSYAFWIAPIPGITDKRAQILLKYTTGIYDILGDESQRVHASDEDGTKEGNKILDVASLNIKGAYRSSSMQLHQVGTTTKIIDWQGLANKNNNIYSDSSKTKRLLIRARCAEINNAGHASDATSAEKKYLAQYFGEMGLDNKKGYDTTDQKALPKATDGSGKFVSSTIAIRPVKVSQQDANGNFYTIFSYICQTDSISGQAQTAMFKVLLKGAVPTPVPPTPRFITIRKTTTPGCENMTKLPDGRPISAYSLAGAVYNLYKDGNFVGTFTTNADGTSNTIDITGFGPGIYSLVETAAPQNYELKSDPYVFMVSDSDTNKIVEVSDKPKNDPAYAIIHKVSPNGTSQEGTQDMGGAKFELRYWVNQADRDAGKAADYTWHYKIKSGDTSGLLVLDDASYFDSSYNQRFTSTQVDGSGLFPVGFYRLVETAPPVSGYFVPGDTTAADGYIDANTNQLTWTSSNWFDFKPTEGYATLKEQNPIMRGISVQKIDTERGTDEPIGDASLAGIKFAVYNESPNPVTYTAPDGKKTTAKNGEKLLELTTDEKGYAETANNALPVGNYSVQEIETNSSMVHTDKTKYPFSFTNDTATTENGGTVACEKDVIVPVYNNANAKMAYSAADDTYKANVPLEKHDVMKQKAEASGNASLKDFEFTVVNASERSVVVDGKVIDTVKDKIGQDATYKQITDTMASMEADGKTCVFTTVNTNAKGATRINNLPYGTYYVVETKAGEGYLINTDYVGRITVRKEETKRETIHDTDVNNKAPGGIINDPPYRSGVKIQKFDFDTDKNAAQGDATLKGAEFKIINASKLSVVNKDGQTIETSDIAKDSLTASSYSKLFTAAKNGYTVQTIYTDENGVAQTGDHDLPYGRYFIIETGAPTGYFLNNLWIGMVDVTEDGQMYEPTVLFDSEHRTSNHDYYKKTFDGDEYATREPVKRGGISLTKIDREMNANHPQLGAELSKAEFTIINASNNTIRNNDDVDIPTAKAKLSANPTYAELRKIADEKKYNVQVITTDDEGFAHTKNRDLPYGTYYVIETKASYGYWLNSEFVGKVQMRTDGKIVKLGEIADDTEKSYFLDNSKDKADDGKATHTNVVPQQPRRKDLRLLKVDIDGNYLSYIPFMISKVQKNPDGTEQIVEQHVIVSDEFGLVDTSSYHQHASTDGYMYDTNRLHSNNTNGFDKYVVDGRVTAEGEKHLKEASKWGVWFQDGDGNDAITDSYGALNTGYYRITELQCNANADKQHNLVRSELLYLYNDSAELTSVINANNQIYTYHPLVDTEIRLETIATFNGDGTKTLPAKDNVEVSDEVSYTHVSADHKYRLATRIIDMTDNQKVVKLRSASDGATLNEDGTWCLKEFQPTKKSGTNSTYGTITNTFTINSKELEGHKLMAVDYLYEYVDYHEGDKINGTWILVARHPELNTDTGKFAEEESQCIYVPDLRTFASDKLTGDRAGAKAKDDAIIDRVEYYNLATNEAYTLRMHLVDAKTGKQIGDTAEIDTVNGRKSKTGLISKRTKKEERYSGEAVMNEIKIDSSAFNDNKTVVVVEELYRADAETGEPIGDALVVHDSLFDEEQTIRWIDVSTSAVDTKTKDKVGTSSSDAVVIDNVKLSNLIFDDNDHKDNTHYTYTVKGHLVYQKDFTDSKGVSHKKGDTVQTTKGTQDTVVITSDASGNISFTYADGTKANGKMTNKKYGMTKEKLVSDKSASNAYVDDSKALICDANVDMIYHVDSTLLEGGTVVVFEYLYHDSASVDSKVEVAKHEDINDHEQSVHYPKVKTTARFDSTTDSVGAVTKEAKVIDKVILTNLVPGNDYIISGKLVNQKDGSDFIAAGNPVRKTITVSVSEDGKLTTNGGKNATVVSYDKTAHQVDGTVEMEFSFDSSQLAGETAVVFEDLIHNGITVASHKDIRDHSQTIYFPKINTNANDTYTKDNVGTVTKTAKLTDTVKYDNLVIGKTYTVSGVLMIKDESKALTDAKGNVIRASKTFVAGEEGDGVKVSKKNDELGSVSGSADITFEFDSSLLEGKTLVAFEKLHHNGIEVTAHEDITDHDQTVHYPKVRTSAKDTNVGDEVGDTVKKTTVVDTVKLWNLVPGKTYTIDGTLMDKDTGKPVLVDGKEITQSATIKVNEDGTITSGHGERTTVTKYSALLKQVDGTVDITFTFNSETLKNKTLVAFEKLTHNDVEVAFHKDIRDLAQTVHFPEIRTTAKDLETNDRAGTVSEKATVVDTVKYFNLVIGKTYTITGTLMNKETGLPMTNDDGTIVTASATFKATKTGEEPVNTVTAVDETYSEVDGEYVIKFQIDASQLAGKTVVAYEDLYHNDVKVTSHADLNDENQTVHYPHIRTEAFDENTGDHVGSIFGKMINGVRHLFGEKDADGNGIADSKQQNIIDTVKLRNLVPGLTYVVSGKLYDKTASKEEGKNIPVVIDGKEVIKSVTITVSDDRSSIKTSDGSKAKITSKTNETGGVDGTVELTYTLDSSKIQGHKVVVFETLYQDASYNENTDSSKVENKDIVNKHEDINDEDQSISEVKITTTAVDTQTKGHVGTVPENDTAVSVINDRVKMAQLIPGMQYTIEGALVDIGASDFKEGKVVYVKADGTNTESREEAYKESFTFVAKETNEEHNLNFSLMTSSVAGKTITVFEDIYHYGIKISSHPSDLTNEDDFKSQTVYYPTGKTNATDNSTKSHMSLASAERTITDRVYFENLVVGEDYTISGHLVYQSDFVDSDMKEHKAGEDAGFKMRAVEFKAAENLTEVPYTSPDGENDQIFGTDYIRTSKDADLSGMAKFDSITVKTLPNGQKVISGYVSLEFHVDATKLEGATLVAYEDFYNNHVKVFAHEDITDKPQTVKIPDISTTATVDDIDEASVHDTDGNVQDITITDNVRYHNLWTKAEYDEMKKQAGETYDITDTPVYVIKGVLMDKETGKQFGEPVYSESFTPDEPDGEREMVFKVNPKDLEGKSLVVFEDLYQVESPDDVSEDSKVAEHHDIEDVSQDVRFPKGRTHATDAKEEGDFEHTIKESTSRHEVYAEKNMEIVDTVTFENLHGATKYEISGKLMTTDEDGNAVAAKDDEGNEITATAELDTTSISADFNANVSGSIKLTFKFSGVSLEGKKLVAFETCTRDGKTIFVHADITDDAQTVYVPKIRTHASDLLSDLKETKAAGKTFIVDKVSYENLEKGKKYTLNATLHDKETGDAIDDASISGTFIAGDDNQFITVDGTKTMTIDEIRALYASEDNTAKTEDADDTKEDAEATDVKDTEDTNDTETEENTEKTEEAEVKSDMTTRVSGDVYVIMTLDASALGGHTVVAFEKLTTETDDGDKTIATHEDIEDEAQSVSVPSIKTTATFDDGSKEAIAVAALDVIDTVYYTNLTAGKEYTVHGTLMNKATGESTGIMAETKFTPDSPDGSVQIKFTVDSSKLNDLSLVAFETLTAKSGIDDNTDVVVASHEDINDEAQTVTIKPPVPDIEVTPSGNVTPTPTNGVDTGDSSNLEMLVMLIMFAGAAAIIAGRKRREEN